jgi:hypothetical protein
LQVEVAQISLRGDRTENQDRVGMITSGASTLLVVLDGMGGHADGSLAAITALASISAAFMQQSTPLLDPLGFIHLTLGQAHHAVMQLGRHRPSELRPRATVALCLVQQGIAYWAHVGDSRIYHLRDAQVLERTRDHSHMELLLSQGRITEAEMARHPMRNYVECCLGGEAEIPEMSLGNAKRLQAGDLLLLCTDGVWAKFTETEIAEAMHNPVSLQLALNSLTERAVAAATPYSDNATAAVLRCY